MCSSYKVNGYGHSAGTLEARTAIAQRYSLPGVPPLTPNVSSRARS
jgi:hypothetical protein